jgi:hypothetical protein
MINMFVFHIFIITFGALFQFAALDTGMQHDDL